MMNLKPKNKNDKIKRVCFLTSHDFYTSTTNERWVLGVDGPPFKCNIKNVLCFELSI